jgi:hypothetical protein
VSSICGLSTCSLGYSAGECGGLSELDISGTRLGDLKHLGGDIRRHFDDCQIDVASTHRSPAAGARPSLCILETEVFVVLADLKHGARMSTYGVSSHANFRASNITAVPSMQCFSSPWTINDWCTDE